ncbi:MAG: hypothetical protein AAF560_03890 [Acidobacteriota bacterium]
MLRRILVVLALLVLAGVGWSLWTLQRGERLLSAAIERFEREVGPFDLVANVPGAVAEQDNAAHWIKEGVASTALTDEDREALNELLGVDRQQVSPGLTELLARHGEAFELLRRAASAEASSWGLDYTDAEAQPPDLLPVLWASKLLAADAVEALEAEDRERFAADARGVAAIHHALVNEPQLLFQILGNHVEWIYLEVVQRALASPWVGPETLTPLKAELEAHETQNPFQRTFAVKASHLRQIFDRSRDTDGIGSWLQKFPERVFMAEDPAAAVDLFYRFSKASDMPANEIAAYVQGGGSPPVTKIIAAILVPNLIDALVKYRANVASRNLALAALDLRLRSSEDGAYPELESLVALDDPYGSGELEAARHEDGSVSLSFPAALARWAEMSVKTDEPRVDPRFAWRLPALAATGSSASP